MLIYRTSCIQLSTKKATIYSQRNINAIHKGDWCMWNMIVAHVVPAFSVPSKKVLSDIAMASNTWRHKQGELRCIR